MQRFCWTIWAVAGLGAFTTAVETKSTIEVDLIFPRNETYAPTRYMPFVFAFQNPQLAQYMKFWINYDVWNNNDTKEEQNMRLNNTVASGNVTLPSVNLSSNDPYLVHDFSAHFNIEGQYTVLWRLNGYWCEGGAQNITLQLWKQVNFFDINGTAPQIDLVAATGNETACLLRPKLYRRRMDIAIYVKGVHEAPETWYGGDKCLDILSNYATSAPCRVKIDDAAAAGIWASVNETMCRYRPYPGEKPPEDIVCPNRRNGAQKPVVCGLACLLLLLGLLLHDPW